MDIPYKALVVSVITSNTSASTAVIAIGVHCWLYAWVSQIRRNMGEVHSCMLDITGAITALFLARMSLVWGGTFYYR